jgi:hypothetical protein
MRNPLWYAAFALAACSSADKPADPPLATPTATASAVPSDLSCAGPVKPGDTVATLTARFGEQARIETLGGAEGLEFAGLVLFGDDPARRLEVIFGDDTSVPASAVRLRGETRWPVGGVRLGDALAKVREANGAAFELWGFGWDYGGYVSDLKDGRLAALPGGCSLSIRFDPDPAAELPNDLMGEAALSSDDPRVLAAKPTVSELTLNFPAN